MFPVLLRNAKRTRLQDDPFSRMFDLFNEEWAGRTNLPVDVCENENGYIIEADMPGFEQKDLDITIEDGILTLAVNRCEDTEEKKENYHVRERRTGSLKRLFRLPDDVNVESIKARLTNGVLRLDLQKKEEAKPRKIDVKVE